MHKKSKSILQELDSLYNNRYAVQGERRYIVESRANNVISSAVRLMEQIEEFYEPEQAENLQRKLLNAIRLRDPDKFARSVKRVDEN